MAGPNILNIANKVNFLSSSPLTLPKTASDPGSAVSGDMYYNSTDNTIHYYNGTTWISISASSLTGQSLASANIIVGNGSNLSAAVPMTGDVSIDNTGNTTLVATTNSSLTTLSSLALPYGQIAGPFSVGDVLYASSTSALSTLGIGTTGQVLTVDVSGVPIWSTTGASGANTALSNLAAVAINTSLLPGADGTINLGNGSFRWAGLFAETAKTAAGTTVVDFSNQNLDDSSGNVSVGWNARTLVDSGAATQLSWSTSGVEFNQLTATTVPFLNGSKILTSSAVTPTQLGYLSIATGTTGTGNLVYSASPTFTGTLSAAAASLSGALNMNSNQINGLGAPSVSTDAATKGYVDSAISGLTWQGPAQAYANSNVPLTGGATLTIDGYPVQNGNLVLLGNQTTASQNGEYTVSGIGTAYVLTPNGLPTAVGDAWLITNGTVFANSAFTATAVVPAATFIEFAGPTAYTFTTPLFLTGNTVAIHQSTTSTDGYLSSTDWNTFNNKQPAGNYITALTGDATASGPGSSALTLATVNASPGTFAIATVTVNGKGLVTSATAATTTGSGSVVLATSPTLTTPNIGAATATSISSTGTLTIDANSGASPVQIESSSVQRSTNGSNFVTETYVDSTTLTNNSGPTVVTAFAFTAGTTAGIEVTYAIENGASPSLVRIGTLRVTASSDGSNPSITDQYTESGDVGVSWTATNSGTAISVSYTATNQTANRTMRADLKSFRY